MGILFPQLCGRSFSQRHPQPAQLFASTIKITIDLAGSVSVSKKRGDVVDGGTTAHCDRKIVAESKRMCRLDNHAERDNKQAESRTNSTIGTKKTKENRDPPESQSGRVTL
jgi:hypothetical protein